MVWVYRGDEALEANPLVGRVLVDEQERLVVAAVRVGRQDARDELAVHLAQHIQPLQIPVPRFGRRHSRLGMGLVRPRQHPRLERKPRAYPLLTTFSMPVWPGRK